MYIIYYYKKQCLENFSQRVRLQLDTFFGCSGMRVDWSPSQLPQPKRQSSPASLSHGLDLSSFNSNHTETVCLLLDQLQKITLKNWQLVRNKVKPRRLESKANPKNCTSSTVHRVHLRQGSSTLDSHGKDPNCAALKYVSRLN